jgi:hypothetical protein
VALGYCSGGEPQITNRADAEEVGMISQKCDVLPDHGHQFNIQKIFEQLQDVGLVVSSLSKIIINSM